MRAGGELRRSDLLAAFLIVLGLVLIWQFSSVLLLLFAAIVLAVPLRSSAQFISRHTPIGVGPALFLVVVLVAVVLGAFSYLFGTRVHSELMALFDRLPDLAEAAVERWNIPNPIPMAQNYLSDLVIDQGMLGSLAGYTSNFVGIFGSIVLVIVSGIYLAANPETYRAGALALVPQQFRSKADTAMVASGESLKRWLLGQLVAMVVVGIATGTGLYFIGLESALALGIVAGLLEFIPFIGPILSAIPAILIALSSGEYTVLYVVGLYVVIQQLENNLLVPLIQRRTADLPPVVGIFAVIALGIAFGPLGLLFGTPLTVVLIVLVKYLYVRGALKEDTTIPAIDE